MRENRLSGLGGGRRGNPFSIHIEVPHHDFIAVGKNVVVVLDEKDHSAKIDALHIVSIEDLAARKHK